MLVTMLLRGPYNMLLRVLRSKTTRISLFNCISLFEVPLPFCHPLLNMYVPTKFVVYPSCYLNLFTIISKTYVCTISPLCYLNLFTFLLLYLKTCVYQLMVFCYLSRQPQKQDMYYPFISNNIY